MSTLSVATIVVSHGKADFLASTLQALSDQTTNTEQVVVVETDSNQECIELAKKFQFSVVEPGDVKLGAAIDSGIQSLQSQPGWLWVLHDDSAPEKTALQMLASAAELSPSVAIVGPKLLKWGSDIEIQQMGITVTPTGKPFLLVQDQYDQGQHDRSVDVLAVSTAGMLVSLNLWQRLGGLDDSTPALAQDIEFCAKARAAGFRVSVEPKARVSHAGLSMAGQRKRKWLGGNRVQALSRAHVHMAGLLLPSLLLPLLYLSLPIFALLAIPQNLIAKRPSRIFGQFSAAVWACLTIPSRLRARKSLRALGKTRALADFYATRAQRKKKRESKFEYQPVVDIQPRANFFSSGAAWLILIPLLVSWQFFPTGSLYAERLVPLGASAAGIWDATGQTTLAFLSGVSLPTEPFNWVLALFGLALSSNPSLALAVFVYVAPTLVFVAFWYLTSLVISKIWVRNLISLVFAVSPQVLATQSQAGVADLVAILAGSWLAYFLIKAATSFTSAKAWRWVGLSGIAGALVAVGSPVLFIVFMLFGFGLGAFYLKRLPVLVWFPIPGIALIYPWVAFAASESSLALLSVSSSAYLAPTQLLSSPALLATIGIAFLGALFAVAQTKFAVAAVAWSLAITFSGVAWYQPIAASSGSQALALGALLIAAGLAVNQLKKKSTTGLATTLGLVSMLVGAFAFGPTSNPTAFFGPARQAPALVVAAAEVDSGIRTLKIEVTSEQVVTSLVWGSGETLEQKSLAYDLFRPESSIDDQLAQLTGSLLAGNPDGVSAYLDALGIDFVLLASSAPELITAFQVGIDSMTVLQNSGQTDFGHLWQVQGARANYPEPPSSPPSRNIQLAILASFLLLAIPTPASIRGSRRAGVRN